MTIFLNLNDEQKQQVLTANQQAATTIRNLAENNVVADKFVYFAAFDGTNNTLTNDGNPQSTNVAELWNQYAGNRGGRFDGNYFSGPGTSGALDMSSWLPSAVTARVIETANAAYEDFVTKAAAWLRANPTGAVTVALTAFSRGSASAAIFSQMLYEKGVTIDGRIVVPPGQVDVSAAILFDPVMTGADVSLAFAPNVNNVVNIRAMNEYRTLFKGADYSNHAGVRSVDMYGNHCDIGGSYATNEDGISSLSLEAARDFFVASGLPINTIPEHRRFNTFDSLSDLSIHDESRTWDPALNAYREVWAAYAEVNAIPGPSRLYSAPYVNASTQIIDGLSTSVLTLYDGSTLKIANVDENSERVEHDSTLGDGSREQVIHHYHGLGADLTRGVLGDEILISTNSENTAKVVDADFYENGETITVRIDSPGTTATNILTVTGIGSFVMNNTQGGEHDNIDLSEMASAVRITLGETAPDSTDSSSFFSVGIAVGGTVVDARGGSADDQIVGSDASNKLEGGAGNDILEGKGGLDTLIGGGGNDTLDSGDDAGGNTLEGGDGYDTYYARENDTIRDADGLGAVVLNGKALTMATRAQGETAYRDTNGNVYVQVGTTLQVNDPLVIEDFDNRDLGIYLDEEDDPEDEPEYDPNVRRVDPLVLDLDGNGRIDTIGSTESHAFFDFNNDGIAERSGWIAPTDGLLAVDVNNNNAIDNLSELFGQSTVSGFDDLRLRIDSNGDNVIDASDADYGKLRVWQDANGDGIAQSGELKSLVNLGISAISLEVAETHIQDADNVVVATSAYLQNGQSKLVADVELAVNFTITNSNPYRPLDQNLVLDADIFQLPWLRGYGLVKSLHQSYQDDPALKQAAVTLVSYGAQGIFSNFDAFLAKWTGLEAAHIARGVTRTNITTGDKIWMLETLTGQSRNKPFIEATNFGGIDTTWDLTYVDSRYMVFANRGSLTFAMQAIAGDWLQGAYFSLGLDKFVATDASRLQSSLLNGLNQIDSKDDAVFGALVIARLKADGVVLNSENLKAGLAQSPYAQIFNTAVDFAGNHVIAMGTANSLSAFGNDGWFIGGSSDHDIINGDAGNDVLIGMAGADILRGGGGNDTYLYARGDGSDQILDLDTSPASIDLDILRFDSSLTPLDVAVSRSFGNLYLEIKGTTDRLTLQNWFHDQCRIERIEFSDGTIWGVNEINSLSSGVPTDGHDYLYGTNEDNLIEARAGNDYVDAGGGNDTIDGGVGNDTLAGGTGNDVYLYWRGDGSDEIFDEHNETDNFDTLKFVDLVASDIHVTLDTIHLYLDIKGTSDRLTLKYWYSDPYSFSPFTNRVEQFEFADGSVWTAEDIFAAVIPTEHADRLFSTAQSDAIAGLGGNDSIEAGAGNDSLDGGAGNDMLYGGDGNDTYLFNLGDGEDWIYETGGIDTVRFGSGIVASNTIVSRYLNDLILSIKDTSDRITLRSWFHSDAPRIEKVEFANGAAWGVEQLIAMASGLAVSDGSDALTGSSSSDYLAGLDGDDTLAGGQGNDFMYGGRGNDLYSYSPSDGDDVISEDGTASGGTDTIRFAGGVAPGDLGAKTNGNDITLVIGASQGGITIRNWFAGDQSTVERIEFSDGTVWGIAEISQLTKKINGSNAADALFGTVESELLRGFGGNDALTGNGGDDTLDGGLGNDSLTGGAGSDVYLFGLGSGHDTIDNSDPSSDSQDAIVLAEGISPSDVSVTRSGDDILISILGTSDVLTVRNWFGSAHYRVETLKFSDGTVWTSTEITTKVLSGNEGPNNISGTDSDDLIYALGGNDSVYGGAGNDTLDGGAGNDSLSGGAGNDVYLFRRGDGADSIVESWTDGTGNVIAYVDPTISAGDLGFTNYLDGTILLYTNDGSQSVRITTSLIERVTLADGTSFVPADLMPKNLSGTSGNDLLVGGWGADTLNGGMGADTMSGGRGDDGYFVDNLQDVIVENPGAGRDIVFVSGQISYTLPENVESLYVGSGRVNGTGNSLNNLLSGNSDVNTLTGLGGDDTLDGAAGADRLFGGAGNDTYYIDDTRDSITENANEGTDAVFSSVSQTLGTNVEALVLLRNDYTLINGTGNSLNNLIIGNGIENSLNGGSGNDIVQGQSGNDTITDTSGNALLDGGWGSDTITGGDGRELFIGGRLDDTITTGNGMDILAFNRFHGNDRVLAGSGKQASTGRDNTISLGRSIAYSDLQFSKEVNDLVLTTGSGDSITLQGWYSSVNNQSVSNLQMIIDGGVNYDPNATDLLKNKKVVEFDFGGLVAEFDNARATDPSLSRWALSSSLLKYYLSSSDNLAIGGDLAYQYGINDNLSNISMNSALAIIGSTQFGQVPQALQPLGALQDMSLLLI